MRLASSLTGKMPGLSANGAGKGDSGAPELVQRARLGVEREARDFTLRLGLPLVPALEEGAPKGAAKQVEHQECWRRFLVDLDSLGV